MKNRKERPRKFNRAKAYPASEASRLRHAAASSATRRLLRTPEYSSVADGRNPPARYLGPVVKTST